MAWISASEDSIRGSDQKMETFWATIVSEFQKHEPGTTRTLNALKGRWVDINREVDKFSGCMSSVLAVNASGKTDADFVEDALFLYVKRYGQRFEFMPSYLFLKDKPKCNTSLFDVNMPHKNNKTNDSGDNTTETASITPARPIGAKKAKRIASEVKMQEIQLSTTQSIANSLKRKNDLLEELNAIEVFGRPEVDPAMAKEYFDLLAKEKLEALKKKMRVAEIAGSDMD
ncbi:hypothetical protein Ae201684P_000321 [Aphanomyces euteiches]|uniref:No apical meristem-associated C-terminal domain-containing protein n=1 Tax=Aphanomyces euteiches TaxID=100861 RepID=A0A6G0XRH1_9STRA|nr:hypothetical protein Ae201684_002126 [Aphanomyces euteiches]KAH9086906.1 hypothetical protein Ae201684P_000321 [Aphanomyces euteiches]KAH9132437.1 hypothetical protein AeRB84_021195 [Aphanomyces euteiches]